VIEFTSPYGSLRLRESGRPAVLTAGGSGIAPMLGLLRYLAQAGRGNRPVRAFYGARQEQDLLMPNGSGCSPPASPIAASARWSPTATILRWTGERGLVHDVAGRLALAEGISAPDLYLCGPPPMVEAAIELFSVRFGVPSQQIFYDKFTTAAAGGLVRVPRPGADVEADVLPAAEPLAGVSDDHGFLRLTWLLA